MLPSLKYNLWCIFVFSSLLLFGQNDTTYKNAFLTTTDSSTLQLPIIKERLTLIASTLNSKLPVILLQNNLNPKINIAQNIAISSKPFQALFKSKNGEPLLNEIFTIYQALQSDMSSLPKNNNAIYYRVEMYNYAYNTTVVGIVDINSNTLVRHSYNMQAAPDVPEHLKKIAVAIAVNSAKVKAELGNNINANNAEMAYTKTALNKSKCERSNHLCVAPTFVVKNKALWTIVDLTDLNLVGIRWTNVGTQDEVHISERTVQNEVINNCYCKNAQTINRAAWQMKYMLTSSDGLKIEGLTFNGKKILKSAKLVDWHVSYSKSDGFGYSDGTGCPMYSLSAVTAWDAPVIADLIINKKVEGFVLEQKFQSDGWPRPCNYNYVQRYEFYNNGNFRITTASIGRGCGNDGVYRPVFRIAFEGNNTFSQYNGSNFTNWQTEKWDLQQDLTKYTANGTAYKITGNLNYNIIPNRGQFNDKSRGDFAYTYITKFKTEEGEDDLVTIGPCCNIDYKQGPEKFMEDSFGTENILNNEIVMWYVPQMQNDNSAGNEYCWAEAKIIKGVYKTLIYPCFVGPLFVPIKP